MIKSLLALIFATILCSSAMAGIQPKFDSYMARYNEISANLEKKKASLKPADYNKLSSELENSRQKMYQGAGSMNRFEYYTFADGELLKLETIEKRLK